MARHDPYDWVDAQHRAGSQRGNVFADILNECERLRAERRGESMRYVERRIERIEAMKVAAADDKDKPFGGPVEPKVPVFTELVSRWK